MDDYATVKETMLESLGDTPASADRRWWTLSRRSGEEIGAFYLRVRSTGMRRVHGLKTREELCEKMILSRFLSTLPPDCYNSVVTKQPKTGLEASRYVQEFEKSRIFSRRNQTWRSGAGQRFQPNGGRGSYDPRFKSEQFSGSSEAGSSQGSSGSVAGNAPSSTGSSSSNSRNSRSTNAQDSTSGSQAGGGRGSGRSERHSQRERKPVNCYGCGESGHIRRNCPNRVRRVQPQGGSSAMIVDGCLAGVVAKGLRTDTGADRTVVRSD